MTINQERLASLCAAIDDAQPAEAKLSPEQWDRIFAFIERILPIIFPFIVGK